MRPKLHVIKAIDDAYKVFSVYERPAKLVASPLRDADAILATLSSAPLRQLTGKQIGPYSGWALTTVGCVADYKHFLPRILEQSVISPLWMGTAPPIIAERLKRAEWRTWPSNEQAAVTAVFIAAFTQAKDEHPDEDVSAPNWLCGLAALGEDMQPLLAGWIAEPEPSSCLQLAALVLQTSQLMTDDRRELAYWTYVACEARVRLASWLMSSEVDRALAMASDIDEVDSWLIQQARKLIAARAGEGRH